MQTILKLRTLQFIQSQKYIKFLAQNIYSCQLTVCRLTIIAFQI